MQAPGTLLDRATLEKLERLTLRWQRSFQGLLGGNNVSRFPGVGHEFLDHRHFHSGDDLRAVNWRAYLRLDRLFLKLFRTEPRTPVRILIDVSESMSCGAPLQGPGEGKFVYACRLAAALTYVGLVRLESVTLQPFSDRLGESFRAQGGRHRFAPASSFLSGLRCDGLSDFAAVARAFCDTSGMPGLTLILSDFLDDADVVAPLRNIADMGHELALIHLAGPQERLPPFDGELELVEAESGALIRVHLDREAAAEHAAAYDAYAKRIERAARRNGGRYERLTTDTSIEEALFDSMRALGAVTLQ